MLSFDTIGRKPLAGGCCRLELTKKRKTELKDLVIRLVRYSWCSQHLLPNLKRYGAALQRRARVQH